MIINNEPTPGVSQPNIDRASGLRQTVNAAASNSGPASGALVSDSIALSAGNDIVQQALTSGAEARAARIQQLQQLIQTNQYHVDALAVSQALIDAHLAGD